MKLILVGVGFFPHVVAGDKNFFTRLVPLLATHCESIDVVSINDCSGSHETSIGGCSVTYHNLKRAFHLGNSKRFFSGQGSLLDYHHKHKPLQEMVEILLSTATSLPGLGRLVKTREAEVIHFMDNMGPSMWIVKKAFPKMLVTHSAMAYAPRGRFYERYLSFSMRSLDKIVPYSDAYARVLRRLGLETSKISAIRWGVEPVLADLPEDRKFHIRAMYGVPDDAKLILWSGFIQQIGEEDFKAAVKVARKILASRADVYFLFAFKPRSYREAFKELESESIRIVTDVECFPELLETADFFYSPLLKQDIIVAPPLTWLEAMSMGTPVITTGAGGVDEVVQHGWNGFVSPSYSALSETVIKALDYPSLGEISRNCRIFVAQNCDIRAIAHQYLRLWEKAKVESRL